MIKKKKNKIEFIIVLLILFVFVFIFEIPRKFFNISRLTYDRIFWQSFSAIFNDFFNSNTKIF
jgi:hypothetical protein